MVVLYIGFSLLKAKLLTDLTLSPWPPFSAAFWAIVENMDQEMQGKLLHFTTGCSRVPLEGFAALRGDGRVCRFTVACTNQPLDELPVRDPSVCVRALVCDSIASH